MKVVGLTGGIATGKTTACHYLHTLSVPIIDADIINHKLLEPNQKGYLGLLKLFPDIPLIEQQLDKKYLRKILFNDAHAKQQIEHLLHPIIKQSIQQEIDSIDKSTPYCIIAVPILIEANFQYLVDTIWVTDCSVNTQITRLMLRDNITIEDAKNILQHQLTREERLSYANEVISTENTIDMQKTLDFLHLQF
ncbi:MAG: dephospho-CoA kinase [Gammaproteobacteria bacterium]|nr:dephospho-CoA kinase [Gammaproteobacteria bacterium]